MPVNPHGQVEQAAAQLGGMARSRLSERPVGVVPLPLGVDQVVGEREAVPPLISLHVRIAMPARTVRAGGVVEGGCPVSLILDRLPLASDQWAVRAIDPSTNLGLNRAAPLGPRVVRR